MKLILTVLGMILLAPCHADTLFRWVDKEGKVHYGDRPASDAVKTEAKRFSAPGDSDDENVSFATRKASQNFPVTLYTTPDCGISCDQGRSYLNKRGVPFKEISLQSQSDIEIFKKKNASGSVPTLFVGKTALTGYAESQWASELDLAGYDKAAAFGFRQRPAPAKQPEPKPQPASDAESNAESNSETAQ